MIELTHQFVAREDRMLELVVELDRSVRAGAHAKLAVEAASDVVHVFARAPASSCPPRRLTVSEIDLDRSVRAVHLTDPAGYAACARCSALCGMTNSPRKRSKICSVSRFSGYCSVVFLRKKTRIVTSASPSTASDSPLKRRNLCNCLKRVHVPFVYSGRFRRSKNANPERNDYRPSAAGSAGSAATGISIRDFSSWSILSRGNVHLNHMMTKITTATFTRNHDDRRNESPSRR